MIVDRLETWRLYFDLDGTLRPDSPWTVAFKYLESLTSKSIECDMTPIYGDNDVMARVMCYKTGDAEGKLLEAHDEYIDIQMSLVNSESILWHPRSALIVSEEYDPASDAVFFQCPGGSASRIVNRTGIFSVFFPEDAHMPGLHPDSEPVSVKKVVVKVRASLVTPSL